MEEYIKDSLISKCQQLSWYMNVRSRKVIAWLTQDVEGRLVPLIEGRADVRRIPLCGTQTAPYIKQMLSELRPFYAELTNGDPISVQETRYLPFRLKPVDKDLNMLLEALFQKMVKEYPQVRARNLLLAHLHSYKEAEQYINDPTLIRNWHGAGQQSVEHVESFLHSFRQEYDAVIAGKRTDLSALRTNADYPFLSIEEDKFITTFFTEHGRYPVFYIAHRYFAWTKERNAKTFAQVNGILGKYVSMHALAEEQGLSFERVRQISLFTNARKCECPLVFATERWAELKFYRQRLITEENIGWAQLKVEEHVEDMDFFSALAILALVRPLHIVSMLTSGFKANSRFTKDKTWEKPPVLFGIDKQRYHCFHIDAFMKMIGHDSSLQKIEDQHYDLIQMAEPYFRTPADDTTKGEIFEILREVMPLFPHVAVEGNDVILKQNRLNYFQEIYRIIEANGGPMTVDAIFEKFLQEFPKDHHTDSGFIRSYMLQDKRFEAVGKKSTYQLRGMDHFTGSLGKMGRHLLANEPVPIPTEELCNRMMQLRGNTTRKSCETSIYLAVKNGLLQYYITDESISQTGLIGLSDVTYPDNYWISPITTEGALISLHRFINKHHRWPFSIKHNGIESRLNYVVRKYTKLRNVTKQEAAQFNEGMADIMPYEYPRTEREATFQRKCQEFVNFVVDHRRMPKRNGEAPLMNWYIDCRSKLKDFDDFQAYQFRLLKKQIRPYK